MMQTDVKSTHLNLSGVVSASRTRIKGVICTAANSNAEVTIYDNASAASGNILLKFDTGATGSATVFTTWGALVPGEGILAQNGVYADLVGGSGATLTVFYG